MISLIRRNAEHCYKKDKRYHVTPLGELPGVTTILSVTSGFSFEQWRLDNPEESERCRQRGIALHDCVEFYFSDDWTKSRPKISPDVDKLYFKLYKSVLRDIKSVVIEHQAYSELGYSGSLDCLGYWQDKLTLFDWKTSIKRKTPSQVTDYLLQISAYANALKETDGIAVDGCAVVIIPEEGNCQIYELTGELITIYFEEFKRRLRWFQNSQN